MRQAAGILRPLSQRDFRLLWFGTTVALLGDGVYLVTLTWQVLALANTPTALGVTGLAMTAPMLAFLPFSGLISDRASRRRVLACAQALRMVAVLTVGVVAIAEQLTLPALAALAAVGGVGQALFGPASGAIVPELVPRESLLDANALTQLVRPMAVRFAGPALGGAVVAWLGPAGLPGAFLLAAGLFGASSLCVLAMRERRLPEMRDAVSRRFDLGGIGEGWRFARSHTWIWATLGSWSVSLLFFLGPFEVLIPYLVKNELGGDAADVGLAFASAGLGMVISALVLTRWGLPRRPVLFMYGSFAIGMGAIGVVGLVDALWQAAVVMLLEGAATAAGTLTWTTLIQSQVPPALLGRVQSLDWLVTQGLVAVSFAITGPVASAIGARNCLILAGSLSAAGQLVFMFVPGLFDIERRLAAEARIGRTRRGAS